MGKEESGKGRTEERSRERREEREGGWRERENVYACWMCNFPGAANRQLSRLRELCGSFEAAYFADRGVWAEALSEKQVRELADYTANWRPWEAFCKMEAEGTRLTAVSDENYPERLKSIPDAPVGLFVRGRLPDKDMPAVAVIGARECSEYGRYVAKRLGAALGRGGVAVISGMARGIDGITQQAALEAGGRSVGVLGSGVDICYPAQNKNLYNHLQKYGAVVSAYPMGTPPRARNFPPRNRIVSGLADAVVVVEAKAKSGTLITVDTALEQGREVYVVPGRVTDGLSEGCNRLIKQGADVLLDVEEFIRDIWERRGGYKDTETAGKSGEVFAGRRENPDGAGDPEQNNNLEDVLPPWLAAVCKALDFYPKSVEEIRMQMPDAYRKQNIAACLMQLCMENLAVQVSPGQFCRKS